MKKILFLSLVLLIILASCKKDEQASVSSIIPSAPSIIPSIPLSTLIPSSTITASVDNVPLSFDMLTMADTTYFSYSGYITEIEGWQGVVDSSDFVSISIVCSNRIVPGNYVPSAFSYWRQADSTMYNFNGADTAARISITAVTDSSIEGTFSGTVYKGGYSGAGSIAHTITGGKFNVIFQNDF